MEFFLLLALLFATLLYCWYFMLVLRRNRVLRCMVNVDRALLKRHELLGPLLELLQPHSVIEPGLPEEILELHKHAYLTLGSRQSTDAHEHFHLETKLQSRIAKLFTHVKRNPELEDNEVVGEAIQRYDVINQKVMILRRHYNYAVMAFNTTLLRFPGYAIGAKLKFFPYPHYAVGDDTTHFPGGH